MRVTFLMAALGVFAGMSTPVLAQTKTVFQAPTGYVSPGLEATMYLADGGSAILNPVVGPNCYLGATCGFPAGYVGTFMSYAMPDGTTASLTNFHGKFAPLKNGEFEITGAASGTDSAGHLVKVNSVKVTMTITCRRGCSKVYTGGTMTLTVE